jgi:hypothetical protein
MAGDGDDNDICNFDSFEKGIVAEAPLFLVVAHLISSSSSSLSLLLPFLPYLWMNRLGVYH